jgi:hypothetical protein
MVYFLFGIGILALAIYLSTGERVAPENPSKKLHEFLALFLYFVALPLYIYLVS